MCFALTSPLFLGISCFHRVPVCFTGPVFSSLRFFCRLCASVFARAVSCSASFSLLVVQAVPWEFLHCEEVSGGPQVVLILGISAGAAASCLFHAGAYGLLGEVFYSTSFTPLTVSFLRPLLDS